MFSVYIIQSLKNKKYYIGHAENLDVRLKKHNSGRVKSTKYGMPWEKVYTENYPTRAEAYRREMEIKSYKSGIKFKKLLGLWEE